METTKPGLKSKRMVGVSHLDKFSKERREKLSGKLVTCSNCKWEGKAEMHDNFKSDYNKWESWVDITCPNCGHAVEIESHPR